ncbi:hypothetical protein SCMU_08790 [Sinomonas cyclohexanicum]|uniref:Uncharacterized protein n=1 Tax=Sinomonas cyclohexanicum TaxID=322009 RepID=A0ABN6FDN9_SINCY|nr:hypothetical protein [Corynebacterium cyclohexanicum]BCT75037.1 hypothetical protein SCMU_08790 [Corynebacterium cyclohexanicum]
MATDDAPTNRVRHYLGAWSAVSVVQFFVAEAATIAAWRGPAPYSRRLNFISDLGQLSCGIHGTREVCSPLHALMNTSFVLQGLGMVIAALLITSAVLRVAAHEPAVRADARLTRAILAQSRTTARGSSRTRIAAALASGHAAVAVPWAATLAVRVLLAVAGAGVAVVGFIPQDTDEAVHLAGAGAYFLCGSSALVVLGILWIRRTAAAWPILLCGGASFVATLVGGALALRVPEPGTLERFMGYPITVGIAVAGGVIAYRLGVPARAARAARRAAGRAAG